MQLDETVIRTRFPRSSTYDRQWMITHSMGPNAVWITEFLADALVLTPGMKVLDLGCGKAMSSVFLAQEFGVEIWANDLWIPAHENDERIREAGLVDQIHAVHAEAHALPYSEGFFDAIVSLDAFHYFGTDDLYLSYIAQFLKSNGQLGIVSPGLMQEFEADPPAHLQPGWYSDFASFHSPAWWSRHWARTGKVAVETADWLADGWKFWAHWDRVCAAHSGIHGDADMVEADAGRNLGFARIVARKLETERWL